MASHPYVAFFDLDRTLIPADSSTLLIKDAYRRGIIKNKKLLIGYVFAILYKLRLVKTLTIITRLATWLDGLSEKMVRDMAADIFQSQLKDLILPIARKEIELHRSKGAYLVLASSSMNYFCELFAAELNLDHIICSRMEVKNGILTGNPRGELCFEKYKMIPMVDFCKNNNYKVQESCFYSDSIDDLPALSAIGKPICINPDKHLKKVAISKGWEIREWR